MHTLNITNGDSAASIIRASGVAGEVLPWRDPMHHGPFPSVLTLDELSETRARYLASPQQDYASCLKNFRSRDKQLRASLDHQRVVLWFEHDLLDQLQILQLLDWFADNDLRDTALELICVNNFDGYYPFRGIGQLSSNDMATLATQAQKITSSQLELATAGWAAFRSANPCDLLEFIEIDLSELPFLRAALNRHLEEYPSTQTGLTRSEKQIMKLVQDGTHSPVDVFLKNMELETALFIGDLTTFSIIENLCLCSTPLLTSIFNGAPMTDLNALASRKLIINCHLELTKTGHEILSGARDAFDCIDRDQWLGGVHLQSDKPMWTCKDSYTGKALKLTH